MLSLGWPFWTVLSLFGAYGLYVLAINIRDTIRDWNI